MVKCIKQCAIFITFLYSLLPYTTLASSIEFSTLSNKPILLLPVPNLEMAINSTLKLSKEGITVNASYSILNVWNTEEEQKYIRLLAIKLPEQYKNFNQTTQNYTLEWSYSKQTIQKESFVLSSLPHLIFPNKSWLTRSILLHPKAEESADSWYTDGQTLFANFISSESLLKEKGYPKEQYSQWLFDRPRAIYQLYILTGDIKWLTEGSKLTDFYINNLDKSGKFKLKQDFDLKYLMPNGLLYDYLLTGDSKIESVLKTLFEQSLQWTPEYKDKYKFWTERHQAAALSLAIAYWEISGSQRAKNRIDEIIEATVQMVFNPINNWPLRGCPQHTYQSHEGKSGNSPVCSPWMMALLGDSLWRYYRLTDDKKSAALLNAFGDFIPNHGIHFANKKLNNMVLPLYLSSMDNKALEIKNQWTDRQHSCDVASLIGKSLYIKKKATEDTLLLEQLFNVFVQQCKDMSIKSKYNKKDYLPMLPPRRFGWTYSTTSDLPWLTSWLNDQ